MTTIAHLDSSNLQLQAGEQAVIPLQIRNNGEIVEGYQLEVVGPPAAWTTVEPASVSLYPGSSTTATLSFHPPRSARVPAGELHFGVVVTPTEHPEEAVVPEGVIEVLPFLETTAELMPRTSQGRNHGRHQIAVDNRGNVPVTGLLSGTDPTGQLRCSITPEALTVGPGEAGFADVRVRPAKRIWRGSPMTHPFVIEVAPQDSPSVQLDGTYVQQPEIPSWLGRALLALVALGVLWAALWYGVFKPVIRSSAEDAVAPQVKEAGQHAVAAERAAGQAGASADKAGGSAGSAAGSAGDAKQAEAEVKDTIIKAGGRLPGASVPFSRRLQLSTPGGTRLSKQSPPVPEKRTMSVTDLVLSNPQGDFGRVEVAFAGRTLFDIALENFRDIDYHFVAPIDVPQGQGLTMTVTCRKPGVPPEDTRPTDECDTSLYYGGTVAKNS